MFSKINNILCVINEPLSNHCTFKIGGNAKFFIYAHNVDALLDVVYTCHQHSMRYKVIGGGSNLLFDDLGYNGAIIYYNDQFANIKENKLYASAGAPLSKLIQISIQHNLSGLEFSVGVPANLGGAIANNFGAYSQEISTYIDHITVIRKNHLVYLSKQDCNFSYHQSQFQNNHDIILSAIFTLPYQEQNITRNQMIEYFNKRKNSQPLNLPNAGSIFKRNNNIIPAKLIDDTGLKGLCVNGAMVSPKHSGFIVNYANAKSKDVLKLIEIIKNIIYEKYNIILEKEIEYIEFNN